MKIFFITLLLFNFSLIAQTDSLKKVIEAWETKSNYQKDTSYIQALNEYSQNLWRKEKLDEAIIYCTKALKFSRSANYLMGEGTALNSLGVIHWHKGKFDSAIVSFETALPIFTKLKINKGIASCLNNIGMLCATKGDDPLALSYFFKALKLNEETNNASGMASSYNNIGIIYKNQKEYDKALNYYFKSLEIDSKTRTDGRQLHALVNIGIIYDLKKLPDSALKYYNQSLILREKINSNQGIGGTYINMAIIYTDKKDTKKAEELLNKAVEYSKKDGQTYTLAEAYNALGGLLIRTGNLNKALRCLELADQIAIDTDSKMLKKSTAKALFDYYKLINNKAQALKFLEIYMALKDSLFNENTRESTLKMQLQYAYEKKQLMDSVKYEKISAKKDVELANQKLELATEKTTKYVLYVGIIFSMLIAFIAFRAYSHKKAANKKISLQKEQIELQKSLVEEKQKEILESIHYAKRIQTSLLPTNKYINRIFSQKESKKKT